MPLTERDEEEDRDYGEWRVVRNRLDGSVSGYLFTGSSTITEGYIWEIHKMKDGAKLHVYPLK